MRIVLLAASASLAAFAAAAPAQAQSSTAGAFVGVPPVNVHRGGANFDFRRDFDRRRHHRGFDNGFVYLDREYQGDTAWKSDSFNDWWHDRPDRAYPRWMSTNQNCERKWIAADTLRC